MAIVTATPGLGQARLRLRTVPEARRGAPAGKLDGR
jgi:hypothetical protein